MGGIKKTNTVTIKNLITKKVKKDGAVLTSSRATRKGKKVVTSAVGRDSSQ